MAKKILIVDDETAFLRILEKRIKIWGYDVICIDNPLQAIDLIKKEKPDLLIFDYKMPDLNGIELLEKIREFDKTTPAFIFTAYPSSKAIRKSKELGVNSFILKLQETSGLSASLRAAIEDTIGK